MHICEKSIRARGKKTQRDKLRALEEWEFGSWPMLMIHWGKERYDDDNEKFINFFSGVFRFASFSCCVVFYGFVNKIICFIFAIFSIFLWRSSYAEKDYNETFAEVQCVNLNSTHNCCTTPEKIFPCFASLEFLGKNRKKERKISSHLTELPLLLLCVFSMRAENSSVKKRCEGKLYTQARALEMRERERNSERIRERENCSSSFSP